MTEVVSSASEDGSMVMMSSVPQAYMATAEANIIKSLNGLMWGTDLKCKNTFFFINAIFFRRRILMLSLQGPKKTGVDNKKNDVAL